MFRRKRSPFTHLAEWTARTAGRPLAFLLALGLVLLWALTGPVFAFSDTWQLVVNTATTIVTFLMVFLIHSTQNRDAEALQLKLDELLRTLKGAHNALLQAEELEQSDLDELRERYADLARSARADLQGGRDDTGVGEVQVQPQRRPRRSPR